MSLENLVSNIQERIETQREDIITFLKELCAIPSMDSQIREVGERAADEMRKLGFDRIWFDAMGNIVGQIGDGPRKLLYDSHLDTVGIGDPDEWEWDPFQGKVEDGVFYARGACDEKGSTPGMIYGLAMARDLGLLDGYTAYYFGNMEEWNDGSAPQAFVETENIIPDFVVIGEPTRMMVYRGHKGRVEMKVVAKGKSAHAASNHLGDNAIYKLVPIIQRISQMQPELGTHEVLGEGRITVTDMFAVTPSINAVPNEATIFIDRRITWGETPEQVIEQVRQIVGQREDIQVELLKYNEPSYTGFVLETDKIYPAWFFEETDPFVQAGLQTLRALGENHPQTGTWNFSTNGTYWAGKRGIPSIGYGPGDEVDAHTVLDRVPLEDVVRSTAFYALLPFMLRQQLGS
ncbi:MAG: YgeY family selenium metabolism-linked hydrolase [Phototrophicales bacterium]|nr:MAG: YgeY family selenium metabolism-linked hydrolase [Phototrophicales bacterium]